ncbi:LacI family DNA-binding transcriptional regulator [Paraburkholderia phymatum]|uniref:Transcriptional regulator, LacI family n=1 Tax=Paraburkholderia phymatum (strain DSM 17167 / CIP 108236 / LMG 21445 / STM815) TaxID=391038 RepID=B2JHU1_PARP8|nr:LacI family DNA-binding transcriptional regulator [Paraburkholderia phymatum]ACC70433.1 transcriptional regulator, LacI family [Paraburkholderia phymatum STM815]
MSTPGSGAPRRATISDVAREAGTGKTSISRYLNGELSVLSPQLRARIEAAIERLDYQPNQMARGLKRGRNRLIGMLVADLTNPYSVEVLQGVEAACHALGYMPLICHAANEVDMERRFLQLLTTYRVEGVIVNALGVSEETLRPVGDGGIPAVLVDRSVDGLVTDMVGLDNEGATTLATRHLVERGFEHVWFVVQPFEHISSRRQREAAFHRALEQYPQVSGRTVVLELGDADELAQTLSGLDAELDAAIAAHEQREGAGRAPHVALFAANGPVALALARHLNQRHGPDWQKRVALLSIDDPEWAELAGITTIRQPTYDIGYRAVEFLHQRIDGEQASARDCLLPGVLIERASTMR